MENFYLCFHCRLSHEASGGISQLWCHVIAQNVLDFGAVWIRNVQFISNLFLRYC